MHDLAGFTQHIPGNTPIMSVSLLVYIQFLWDVSLPSTDKGLQYAAPLGPYRQ
jgi:hypothetical protein